MTPLFWICWVLSLVVYTSLLVISLRNVTRPLRLRVVLHCGGLAALVLCVALAPWWRPWGATGATVAMIVVLCCATEQWREAA